MFAWGWGIYIKENHIIIFDLIWFDHPKEIRTLLRQVLSQEGGKLKTTDPQRGGSWN